MHVRWGFLGAGWIAQRAMAGAVQAASGAALQAVASTDRDRSAALEPVRVHDTYAELLDDPDVDACYIALANHQHRDWVLRALAAGKHVLCEKPLGLNADEVRIMAAAAVDADRLLVEATWCRWHPRFQRLMALATNGELGALEGISTTFTFTTDIGTNYRSQAAMGGGALLDTGGYQAHSWVAATGGAQDFTVDAIERTMSEAHDGGVDLSTRVAGLIAPTVHVSGWSSFIAPEHQSLTITGSDLTATALDGAAFTTWREESSLLIGTHIESFPAVDAYQLMIEQVSSRVRGEDSWVVPLADSLRVAEILDICSAPHD
jgi:xylose dehydrogenase (NAD/NADP)